MRRGFQEIVLELSAIEARGEYGVILNVFFQFILSGSYVNELGCIS